LFRLSACGTVDLWWENLIIAERSVHTAATQAAHEDEVLHADSSMCYVWRELVSCVLIAARLLVASRVASKSSMNDGDRYDGRGSSRQVEEEHTYACSCSCWSCTALWVVTGSFGWECVYALDLFGWFHCAPFRVIVAIRNGVVMRKCIFTQRCRCTQVSKNNSKC
jgi:hypothetical protein